MRQHLLMLTLILLVSPLNTVAAEATKKEEPKKEEPKKSEESDKLDVQKLEQKYWSAKDDDFTVVQNRAFSKEKRWYLNVGYGSPINDPFSTGSILGLNLGYYISERWGFEFNYRKANFHDNDSSVTFKDTSVGNGVSPDTNRFLSSKIFNATWVPLYAKMSWLDRKIIYFDMGLQLGLGQTEYSILRENGNLNKSAMTYSLNVMQHYFFSEHFALRIDFANTWTGEERKRFSGVADRPLPSKSTNDTSLMFGITYWK